jgi:DNA-binding transcriptional MerR regulator
MGEVVSVFTAEQVARLTGVSKTTLAEWSKLALFEPEFSERMRSGAFGRTYSFRDIVAVKTLQVLRYTYKVPKLELRKTAEFLHTVASKPWAELTLYVRNKEVHFQQSDGEIVGTISGQKTFPIPLESVAQEMKNAAVALRKRSSDQYGKTDRHRLVASNQEVFLGTRIPVSLIVSLLVAGRSDAELLSAYGTLNIADIELAKQRITKDKLAA